MADLIDRHVVIEEISKYHITSGITGQATWNECVDIIIETLESLPSAQPQRKKGKWINHRKDDGHNIADCDQCGNAIQWFDGDEIPRYCCMCGARMDGGESDGCNNYN